ncbi:MAG TPA: tail fiber protein [Blastocatellia bacterium]|nr:tail fiber protein [Blastocatellia bacterium]
MMGVPFIGEIRMFGGNYAPLGWAFCNGQQLPIAQYDALFNLIGTTYGGDGQTTFNLPNLQGRVPIHQGGGYVIGAMGGVEQVRLSPNQIPTHTHAMVASAAAGNQGGPAGNVTGQSTGGVDIYTTVGGPSAPMGPGVASVGATQPHNNLQPFLCVSFIISLEGIYPSQG